jgi:hypothetical protein
MIGKGEIVKEKKLDKDVKKNSKKELVKKTAKNAINRVSSN